MAADTSLDGVGLTFQLIDILSEMFKIIASIFDDAFHGLLKNP
jgi:hypothetical protein